MYRIIRDSWINELSEQLAVCRIQGASLDNDAEHRIKMAETIYAIRLLLDLLERKEGWPWPSV